MTEDIVKFLRWRDYRYVRELGKGGCGKTVLLHDDVMRGQQDDPSLPGPAIGTLQGHREPDAIAQDRK